MSAERRVVATGMGAVAPSGHSVAALWDAVAHGRSAVSLLDGPEFEKVPVRIGGRVTGFDATGLVPTSVAKRIDPVQLWAIGAADQAMRQAGVLDGGSMRGGASAPDVPWARERFAVISATGSGPIDAMQQATRALDNGGPRAVPFSVAVYGAPDGAAAILAERYGAFGASQAVSATCASGAVGLGAAMRWIRHGYVDAVLVVGMEDCLNGVNLSANARMRALAAGYESDPESACRPFDLGRTGFVMSQGAAAIVLEAEGCAIARSASPLAEMAGFGASSDAHHPTAPEPNGRGAAQAIRECLADTLGDSRSSASASDIADVAAQIDHINAHGTGTPLGDRAEIAALRGVFGDRALTIPLTATKSSTGHLLGASGVVEAIVTVETMRHALIPPTLNLTDPEFPDWDIVTSARHYGARTALSTSFGFGGHNAALIIRTCDERNGHGRR